MKKRILLSSLLALSIVGCTSPILNNTSQYSDLDKEYSQFKTQALTQSYLKKKMDKWLSDGKYSKNLVREIEYAKFKHPTLLKDIVALQPAMFNSITGNTGVTQKRSEPSFETYIQNLNPFPSDVTATTATAITSTSFTANWNAVTNATGYKLYIDGIPITLGLVTTYNKTTLVDGSSHSYYVKAINSAGESSVSNTINVTLPSAAPVATSATSITTTGFTANWNAVTGATGYKLYIDGGLITLGNVTSYNKSSLTAGTSHNYYVKAILNTGDTPVSNTISLRLIPSVPVATSATDIITTAFTANWNAVTNATGYKLYIDSSLTPIDVGNVTSYYVIGLTNASSHSYYVKAINTGGESSVSNTINLTTLSVINEFKVSSYTDGAKYSPSIAMADDGKYIISWESMYQDGDMTGIYAQRYNADGSKNGSEFKVSTYNINEQRNSSIAMADDGKFVITWFSRYQDGDEYGVYAQLYNADGSKNGSEFRVNTYTTNMQWYQSVAMANDGKFIITWQSVGQDGDRAINYQTNIYAQKYNADGSKNGSEFRVNTYTTGGQYSPSMAMDYNGQFVITWYGEGSGDTMSDDIYAQRYNADGSKNGSQFLVNTYTTDSQQNAKIAMSDDGKFVISWSAYGQDGDSVANWEGNIYAQKYNADGSKNGSEFRVNTYITNNQDYSSLAIANDGKFVISWQSQGQDGNNWGVYSQKYNADGSKNGSEFRVNNYTTGNQQNPSIAMDGNGNFINTWDGSGNGDVNGIFAKRFDSNGNVL